MRCGGCRRGARGCERTSHKVYNTLIQAQTVRETVGAAVGAEVGGVEVGGAEVGGAEVGGAVLAGGRVVVVGVVGDGTVVGGTTFRRIVKDTW